MKPKPKQAQPNQATAPRKKRGVRKPRGYEPGNVNRNLYIARKDYVPGDDLVSGYAQAFYHDCLTAAQLHKVEVVSEGGDISAKPGGYDQQLMQHFKMNQKRVRECVYQIGLGVIGRVIEAARNKQADFFKDIVRLCETPRPADISLRSWLIYTHWDLNKVKAGICKQDWFYTAKELCERAKARLGVTGIDQRRMHEICGQLGIELKRQKGWKKLRRVSN